MADCGRKSKFESLTSSDAAKLASFRIWFDSNFKTPTDCLNELYRRLQEAGIAWRCCSTPIPSRESGQRTIHCLSCNAKTSITAGTFFHRIKRVRAWLALILMVQEDLIINPFQFHKFFEVAYATAAEMFKKLRSMFEQTMHLDCPLVPSSSFTSIIFRRSRKTPAEQHPVSEFEVPSKSGTMDVRNESATSLSNLMSLELSPSERQVFECLPTTEKIHFDKLCNLTGLETSTVSAALIILELSGLAKPLRGDYYLKAHPEPLRKESTDKNLQARINNSVTFIGRVYQGISKRYLQLYLAEYWYYANKENLTPNFLFLQCIKAHSLDNREMLNYESPNNVRLA